MACALDQPSPFPGSLHGPDPPVRKQLALPTPMVLCLAFLGAAATTTSEVSSVACSTATLQSSGGGRGGEEQRLGGRGCTSRHGGGSLGPPSTSPEPRTLPTAASGPALPFSSRPLYSPLAHLQSLESPSQAGGRTAAEPAPPLPPLRSNRSTENEPFLAVSLQLEINKIERIMKRDAFVCRNAWQYAAAGGAQVGHAHLRGHLAMLGGTLHVAPSPPPLPPSSPVPCRTGSHEWVDQEVRPTVQ